MESNDPVAQINQILGSQQSDDPNVQAVNNIVDSTSDNTDSANVTSAQSQLGNQDDNGFCQKFVEEATYGKSGIFPSAIDAWDSYTQSGQAYQGNVQKAPSGTLIYFAPDSSNDESGHVGISNGKGDMISATYNGVQVSNIDDWIKNTGQVPLGYVKP